MRKSVRVSTQTRDALRQIRLGKPYSSTIAALAGRWQSLQIPVERVETHDSCETTIKVSEGCHAVLTDLRDDMGVDSVGDVLAVLVANWRV